jgi:hypothetical protein
MIGDLDEITCHPGIEFQIPSRPTAAVSLTAPAMFETVAVS